MNDKRRSSRQADLDMSDELLDLPLTPRSAAKEEGDAAPREEEGGAASAPEPPPPAAAEPPPPAEESRPTAAELLAPPAEESRPTAAELLAPPVGQPPAPAAPAASPGSAKRWLWLLVLLALPLGAIGGYFLKLDPALMALSDDLLDFGEVRIGSTGSPQRLEIQNQGERSLAITQLVVEGEMAKEFAVVADECTDRKVPAEARCSVGVAFTPVDGGSRKARLEIRIEPPGSPQSVPVIGIGVAPRLGFEPAELDFGEHTVTTASSPATLWLSNSGSAPVALGRVELAGLAAADFVGLADECSSRTLPPGERCSLRYRFVPTAVGERRVSVWVASDASEAAAAGEQASDRQEAWLVGTGLAQEPLLRLDPEHLDFEPTLVGESSPPQTVTFTNEGTGPLTIHELSVEGTQGRFDVLPGGCDDGLLAPDTSCSADVVFRPSAEGAARAVLEIRHDAGGGLHRVALIGTGTAPHIFLDPLRLSFGEVPVGKTGGSQTVRIVNSGTGALRVGGVRTRGADAAAFPTRAGSCTGAPLEPGANCTIGVRFQPRREGPHRAELVIDHTAAEGVHRLPLNGLGTTARLSLDRTDLDFGEVRVAAASNRRLGVSNTGRATLGIRRVRLTGRYARDFELTGDGCSAVALGPGESCNVNVRFVPFTAGSRTAVLEIEHDAAGSPREVALSATATPPPAPEIRIEPSRLEFASQQVGEYGPILNLTVRNTGTAPLVLKGLRLTGEHAQDFLTVAGSCDETPRVPAGGECTIGVRMAPTVEGARSARLAIDHNAAGGPHAVELAGRGTAPPIP
ncbi:MAG: choice-of-anchor D domain-containing protein [bacterium]|nr:choice-of-anchor D domain-containing protein [bacterium]